MINSFSVDSTGSLSGHHLSLLTHKLGKENCDQDVSDIDYLATVCGDGDGSGGSSWLYIVLVQTSNHGWNCTPIETASPAVVLIELVVLSGCYFIVV